MSETIPLRPDLKFNLLEILEHDETLNCEKCVPSLPKVEKLGSVYNATTLDIRGLLISLNLFLISALVPHNTINKNASLAIYFPQL